MTTRRWKSSLRDSLVGNIPTAFLDDVIFGSYPHGVLFNGHAALNPISIQFTATAEDPLSSRPYITSTCLDCETSKSPLIRSYGARQ